METAPCPISNSREFVPYLQVPDRFDTSGKAKWNLVRSCSSGLIMLNPRPDSSEIAPHYKNGKYDPYLHTQNTSLFKDRCYLAARSLLLHYRANLVLNGLAKPVQKCRILEIGCSTGDLLNYLHRKSGIPTGNLAGVEPDHDAANYARKIYRLNIFPSLTIESTEKNKFDRIVLWHTLEHIHAIHDTINHAANQLETDGILVIALPNPASSDAKHYRENWIAYDAPRHLYHFIPGTLEKLLESHKLSVFKQTPYIPDLLYNTFHSEALLCKRQGRSFKFTRILNILSRVSVNAVKGYVAPSTASSLIYFVRKKR
jgi:2-polyprenyl-3-methyl-5-hydroxy-6-metoxy-1,4-benzoquinol methylase